MYNNNNDRRGKSRFFLIDHVYSRFNFQCDFFLFLSFLDFACLGKLLIFFLFVVVVAKTLQIREIKSFLAFFPVVSHSFWIGHCRDTVKLFRVRIIHEKTQQIIVFIKKNKWKEVKRPFLHMFSHYLATANGYWERVMGKMILQVSAENTSSESARNTTKFSFEWWCFHVISAKSTKMMGSLLLL